MTRDQTLEKIRSSNSNNPLDCLQRAIVTYENGLAKDSVKKAIEQGIDPVKTLNAMTAAIRLVGNAFGSGELFLPDLVGAADAMQSAMPLIEAEIIKRKSEAEVERMGVVVAGTVLGDIHDIGKSMVTTLLIADGFTVRDLGVNVKAEEFVEAVKETKPDILAMSALMAMTASEQRKVIEVLEKEGLRDTVKVMVGGGAITQEFANSIGADGYDPTAPGAVKLAKRLIQK